MRASTVGGKGLSIVMLFLAYPALRQLPCQEWDDVLAQARETNFDAMEWLGIAAGVAFATYLLRFDADQAAALTLPARYFIQFLGAVPLLLLTTGPFYLRRTRRGLDQEIRRRYGDGSSDALAGKPVIGFQHHVASHAKKKRGE